MEDSSQSRQQLRTILADPDSTPEQIIRAKLILAQRIAKGPEAIRQVCTKYRLSSEQTAEMMAGHHARLGELEIVAEQEVQRLERLPAQAHPSSEAEQPAT